MMPLASCICGEAHAPHPVPLLSTGLTTSSEVVAVEALPPAAGRRAWACLMADGVREVVVELRQAPPR